MPESKKMRQLRETIEKLHASGYERVHAEGNWYDGPLSGIADVQGKPHYFTVNHAGRLHDSYLVWPVEPAILELEKTAYGMFVEWWEKFERGEVESSTHPMHSASDSPYNMLTARLLSHRQPPADARKMVAKWQIVEQPRYTPEGPNYLMKWTEA
jgi:hypothetical protein